MPPRAAVVGTISGLSYTSLSTIPSGSEVLYTAASRAGVSVLLGCGDHVSVVGASVASTVGAVVTGTGGGGTYVSERKGAFVIGS